VQVAPQSSFLVGHDDNATLLQPVNSDLKIGWSATYRNRPDDCGMLTVTVQRAYTNDVSAHFLQTAIGAFNVRSVKSELDTIEIRKEWDDNQHDGVEIAEFAVGSDYQHPGPAFVTASDVSSSYYRVYASLDVFVLGEDSYGFEDQNRRLDIGIQVGRGTHRAPPSDPTSDQGAKLLLSFVATYKRGIGQGGRSIAYVNYSNVAHYYDGTTSPLHGDDFEVGLIRQGSPNTYYELHVNSLTKKGVTTPQFLPVSGSHLQIDAVVRFWLSRAPHNY